MANSQKQELRPSSESFGLELNDSVEAFNGKYWYTATVLDFDDRAVTVHYNNWSSDWDETVEKRMIRKPCNATGTTSPSAPTLPILPRRRKVPGRSHGFFADFPVAAYTGTDVFIRASSSLAGRSGAVKTKNDPRNASMLPVQLPIAIPKKSICPSPLQDIKPNDSNRNLMKSKNIVVSPRGQNVATPQSLPKPLSQRGQQWQKVGQTLNKREDADVCTELVARAVELGKTSGAAWLAFLDVGAAVSPEISQPSKKRKANAQPDTSIPIQNI